MIDSLLKFLKKNPAKTTDEAPEGVCPNCWGTQDYGNQFYAAIKNEHADVNTASTNIGWVQDYANKHLKEIELNRVEGMDVCQKCKVSYRPA